MTTDPKVDDEPLSEAGRGGAESGLRPKATADAGASGHAVAANKLTPQEQMALFEQHLKENDWGHQPC